MCGISGFISSNSVEDSLTIINEMMQRLHHRGPDYHSAFITSCSSGNLTIGHNLLSIIGEPKDGRQPYETQWGVLSFNGAIYNFEELRQQLGFNFRTDTDTEVLAVGLGLEGIKFIEKLRGMYSFAYFDKNTRQLHLVRDFFGIKPLYYIADNKAFSFASEYKVLLPFHGNLSVDQQSVAEYLQKRFVPAENTLFSQIKKMPRSSILTVNIDTLDIKLTGYQPAKISSSSDLVTRLKTAIKRRKVASVEVAGLLSGGIDSGLVCDYLSEGSSNFKAYTLDVGDEGLNETNTASKVARKLNVDHNAIPFKPSSLNQLRALTYHLDDPYGDPIIISMDHIFSFIQSKQRVIVTGEGSDELFSGYIHHRAMGLFEKFPSIFLKVAKYGLEIMPIKLFRSLLPYAGKLSQKDLNLALNRFKKYLGTKSLYSFQSIFHLFDDEDLQVKVRVQENRRATLADVRAWDFNNWLPSSQLLKLDKISMKSSIEAREPFMDYDLYESISSIDPQKHISLSNDKVVLRKAVSGHTRLPAEIVRSRKTSFFQPVNSQTAGDLIIQMRDLVAKNKDFLGQFIKLAALNDIITSEDSGLLNQKKLFCLSCLVLWKEEILSIAGKSTLRVHHG